MADFCTMKTFIIGRIGHIDNVSESRIPFTYAYDYLRSGTKLSRADTATMCERCGLSTEDLFALSLIKINEDVDAEDSDAITTTFDKFTTNFCSEFDLHDTVNQFNVFFELSK